MTKEQDANNLAEKVISLNKKKRNIYIIFFVMLGALVILMFIDNMLVKDKLLCQGNEDYKDKKYKKAMQAYLIHKCFEFFPALFTTIWLSVPTSRLKRILERKFGDASGFRCEILKIHGTNIAFISAVVYTCVFTIYFTYIYIKYSNDKASTEKLDDVLKLKILTVSIASYIPIAAIVANHFNNI